MLTDTSVDKETRVARAKGLKVLGNIFESAQSEETKRDGKRTLRQQMEAFVGVMTPAGGVDSDDELEAEIAEDEAAAAAATGAPAAAPVDDGTIDEAGLRAKSVKELKQLCKARGVDTAGCSEKGDLVKALLAAAS